MSFVSFSESSSTSTTIAGEQAWETMKLKEMNKEEYVRYPPLILHVHVSDVDEDQD